MTATTRTEEIGTVEEGPLSAVLAALARDDPSGVVAALDGQLHHGRPGSPAALRQQVGERLAMALAEQSGRVTRWIDALSTSSSPTARQVACLLLVSRYPEDPIGVLGMAELLADDPHWEVREAAGGLLGSLLDRDFDRIRGRLEVLRSAKSENLRRAVVLAVKYAARRDKPERVADLLRLLEPLLRDPEPYVRRNLGPYTIGDALLRVDPKETLKALKEWSRDRDQTVRWNVAMAFSARSAPSTGRQPNRSWNGSPRGRSHWSETPWPRQCAGAGSAIRTKSKRPGCAGARTVSVPPQPNSWVP